MQVKTRKWAKFAPAWTWAVGIDLLDFSTLPLTTIASVFPPLAELGGFAMDAVQGIIAFAAFDDVHMWLGGTALEGVLPSTGFGVNLDLFPTYTAIYIAKKEGWLK
jgi:hypothetical protein